MKNESSTYRSAWLHRCAWVLACATFPLIWVGGLVTTTDAGMAFRDWMTSDGTFFLFYDWLSSAGDKFVEHGHRLLAALAGFLSIALVFVAWRHEPRSWVQKFSLVLLAGVILQGVLGGMRVVLDERLLALIHGCTGPLFFSLCVGMVVVTSRWWHEASSLEDKPKGHRVFRLAIVCTVLAYLQLVVGAVVRHSPYLTSEAAGSIFQIAVYFHLFLALMIMVHVFLLAFWSLGGGLQRWSSVALMLLIGAQVALGLGTWLVKYGMPAWASSLFGEMTFVNHANDSIQSTVITSHVAVGSLILVTSLAVALRMARQLDIRLAILPLIPLRAMEVAS